MVTEHTCSKCERIFNTKRGLEKHLKRKYKCDEGNFQCKKCSQCFNNSSNLSQHRKTCKGRELSVLEKDQEIRNYKTILAATGNQRTPAQATSAGQSNVNNHNGTGDIINGDQINNIQNNTNIIVLPLGSENIDHIRKLSISELQDKIGLKSDPSTMIKLFELIRTDENHPENHTMLLPELNGQTVHCKVDDGWKTDSFNNGMQRAIHHDNSFLIRKLPDNYPDKVFQDGYIMNEIQQKINFCDHAALKKIYDGVREALYDLTMRLARQNNNKSSEESSEINDKCDNAIDDDDLVPDSDNLTNEEESFRLAMQKIELERRQIALDNQEIALKQSMLEAKAKKKPKVVS